MARVESVWKSQTGNHKVQFDATISITAAQASIHLFLLTASQGRDLQHCYHNVSYQRRHNTKQPQLLPYEQFGLSLSYDIITLPTFPGRTWKDCAILSVLTTFQSDFSWIWKSNFCSVQTGMGYLMWCNPQENNAFWGWIYSLQSKKFHQPYFTCRKEKIITGHLQNSHNLF